MQRPLEMYPANMAVHPSNRCFQSLEPVKLYPHAFADRWALDELNLAADR